MREFSSFLNDVKTAKSKSFEINLASGTPAAPKVRRHLLFVTDESRRSVHLAKVKSLLAKILKCKTQNLLITMGASSAFLHAIAAITQPGDKVIVEDPTYEPLYATSKFLSLKTLRFKRTSDFNRDYAQLKKMRAKSGVLIISNPHNPTGWMYSKAQLQKLAKLFEYVVVDEIFLPIFTGESTRAAKVGNR